MIERSITFAFLSVLIMIIAWLYPLIALKPRLKYSLHLKDFFIGIALGILLHRLMMSAGNALLQTLNPPKFLRLFLLATMTAFIFMSGYGRAATIFSKKKITLDAVFGQLLGASFVELILTLLLNTRSDLTYLNLERQGILEETLYSQLGQANAESVIQTYRSMTPISYLIPGVLVCMTVFFFFMTASFYYCCRDSIKGISIYYPFVFALAYYFVYLVTPEVNALFCVIAGLVCSLIFMFAGSYYLLKDGSVQVIPQRKQARASVKEEIH